ncbi:MAG: hypothetical protein OEW42_11090 [Acidimicrobiia bacterium]|nr:hypothetical protein [Acidimicrobiia bacterium]
MTEKSLSKDPFVRRTAITATIIAVVLAIGASAAYLLTRSSAEPEFDVALGLVSPTDENRVAPGLVDCPTEPRAPSPLLDSAFATSTQPVERSGFGTGQLVAYNVRFIVASDAPDTGRFVLRFSQAFEPGLRCAFVATDDPDTDAAGGAQMNWLDASGAEPAGQIELTDVTPGDSIVTQLWVALREGEDPGRQMSLTVTPGEGTDANPVTRSDRISLGLPTTATGDPSVTIDDGTEPAPLGQSQSTRYIVTNETSAVLNRVQLTASIDEDAIITGARVDDREGHPTSCLADAGRLMCDLGFLNPGESVPVIATLTVDATAISFWGRDTGRCARDGEQDLCQRAVLTWAGPFSSDSTEVTEVTNVDDTSVFSVGALPAGDTAYALGSIAVTISVTTDAATAEISEVSTNGCPVATYVSGDTDVGPAATEPAFITDGDGVLNAGEVWFFTCSARQFVDETILVLVTGTAEGLPGRTTVELPIEVISPAIVISRIDGADTTWTVTNSGDTPLESVAVSAPGCSPQRTGAGNNDAVLDVAEAWTYTCPTGAGTGRAFAIDPLGNTVSGADETFDPGT